MSDVVQFTVQGQLVSMKNSRIWTGKRSVKSARAQAYEEAFLWEVKQHKPDDAPWTGPVAMHCDVWYDNVRSDLDVALIMDLLQDIRYWRKKGEPVYGAGFYGDDNQIVRLDLEKHIDPENPRVTIKLRRLTDDKTADG